MQLLVDDGVSSRGHRTNLMNPASKFSGVASGPHSRYNDMTCVTYAGSYVDDADISGDSTQPVTTTSQAEILINIMQEAVVCDPVDFIEVTPATQIVEYIVGDPSKENLSVQFTTLPDQACPHELSITVQGMPSFALYDITGTGINFSIPSNQDSNIQGSYLV